MCRGRPRGDVPRAAPRTRRRKAVSSPAGRIVIVRSIDFLTNLPLTTWWPLRAPLIVATGLAAGLLVWRGRRWWSRVTLVLLLIVLLPVDALAGVNAYYGYYLVLGQALGHPAVDTASPGVLNRHTPPENGAVVSLPIPAPGARFYPRPAQIYLPPAWFSLPRPHLPVLMLLHGTPGSPGDWTGPGMAQVILDRWAHTHHGYAPIVVMPDINGSVNGDTECVNGARGRAENYLSATVPRFVQSRFATQDPGRAWAVAGLSEGGTCALMLTLLHPQTFSSFGDYSGLIGPRAGDTNNPGGTLASLFGGSQRAFTQHQPTWLLNHHRYPNVAGWFETGDDDPAALAAAHRLAPLAHRAGISTSLVVIPGDGHSFALWRDALAESLPWISHRITLTPHRPSGR